MDEQAAETAVRTYLTEIRTRIDKAAGIARAADACAGFCDEAAEISLDIEQPLYEYSATIWVGRARRSGWRVSVAAR
ncbi:hypothetical protein [Bradyrhizobium elkanii]|uniref:hypothetical protein n=1 Tax=Bradyrhizobium elkanii TaxID=29448 RepID=UPI002226391F|nr:hypothetical protein [Bradyrhizobium elkanii]MCW2126088.1 hypothetical protein [Bradyrhizobium elkanii]MCW2172834.1 hypothetical protein [Bradyrhizobium elkanii]